MRHIVAPGVASLAALAFVPLLIGAAMPRSDLRTLQMPQAPSHFRGAHPSHAWRMVGGVRRMVDFPTQIQHVVVVVMENRTVDNLFAGYYGQYFGNGQTWDQALNLANPNDSSAPLQSTPLEATFDPNHGHEVGFKTEAAGNWGGEIYGCPNGRCPSNTTNMAFVPTSETASYAYFIQNYAFANAMYQANEGPSFPAHQYLIAGQSGGLPGSVSAPFGFAENPQKPLKKQPQFNYLEPNNIDLFPQLFCTNTVKVTRVVNMTGPYSQVDSQNTPIAPCDEYGSTILDEMTSAYGAPDVNDWQYVSHSLNSIWSAPMAVNHLAQEYSSAPNKTNQPFAVDGNALQFIHSLQVQSPVRPFANVTYVTPCFHSSDHPVMSGISNGPTWLPWFVNQIGQSKYWPNTTIIVVWDDWGGWYDHAQLSSWPFHPPNNFYGNPSDPNEWGFRIPMMVISPYVAQRGYVSSNVRSQSAILRYVEDTFGLPSLGADDAAGNDDLADMFNMNQQPLTFTPYPLGSFKPKGC